MASPPPILIGQIDPLSIADPPRECQPPAHREHRARILPGARGEPIGAATRRTDREDLEATGGVAVRNEDESFRR